MYEYVEGMEEEAWEVMMVIFTVHHSCRVGGYIQVCRQLVKQSRMGPINRVGPCKHHSLSAKRWPAGTRLL